MKQMIVTLSLMIVVGVLAFAEGRDRALTQTLQVRTFDLVETGQPHVVLATAGTRQQKETRQGCPVLPNGDLSQQKSNDREDLTMKGLVF